MSEFSLAITTRTTTTITIKRRETPEKYEWPETVHLLPPKHQNRINAELAPATFFRPPGIRSSNSLNTYSLNTYRLNT